VTSQEARAPSIGWPGRRLRYLGASDERTPAARPTRPASTSAPSSYWAWEQELIDAPPRFPGPRDQRDVAGRHYLTKAEINALYFATHKMGRPRGWDSPHPIGRY
jgi:hypothetical protein